MRIIKETNEYVKVRYHEGDPVHNIRPNEGKQRKFLCIGGPLNGQMRAEIQLHNLTYVAYNSASGGRRSWKRDKRFTQLWIHQSLLV